ncbi:uncharacterized protein EI90DRAFT_3291985 [Cantharellus anzutake]|uniref:uncharacterized protein n=1 Tax=Cantharellus anzutake TaxID=1750568 RepID=UPI0019061F19|nr:uncharacterized protein EI90DRAFT_3291985 [Cantharellus anzutake]KAF8324931.1 hypothetical protein EI90DRAFT_3291985 [Cantharellus anzutake]
MVPKNLDGKLWQQLGIIQMLRHASSQYASLSDLTLGNHWVAAIVATASLVEQMGFGHDVLKIRYFRLLELMSRRNAYYSNMMQIRKMGIGASVGDQAAESDQRQSHGACHRIMMGYGTKGAAAELLCLYARSNGAAEFIYEKRILTLQEATLVATVKLQESSFSNDGFGSYTHEMAQLAPQVGSEHRSMFACAALQSSEPSSILIRVDLYARYGDASKELNGARISAT